MLDPHHETIVFIVVLLVVLAATLLSLARRLPAQNVIAVAAIIAFISSLLQTIGAKTGIPFGHFFYTENLPSCFHLIPWPVPMIWVVMILNSRGVARLILQTWRNNSRYGLWSLVLTCALTVVFDLALEPYAASNQFWIWQIPKNILSWHGTPWINFISMAAATLLILLCATPWLINKKLVAASPPDYFPLIIWSLLMFLLILGNVAHQVWAAAFFTFVLTTIVAASAWRNSQWQNSD